MRYSVLTQKAWKNPKTAVRYFESEMYSKASGLTLIAPIYFINIPLNKVAAVPL